MENEPQIQPTEDKLEQNRNIRLLISALEIANSGYYRVSIPKEISSELLLAIVRNHISGCEIIVHRVTTTPKPLSLKEKYESYDDDIFFNWLFDISRRPDNFSEQPRKKIFVLDLSEMPSEEGIDVYFVAMNLKRGQIVGNPNGPTLVITRHLSEKMERFIHGCPDLQSCCSGKYTI